MVGLLLSAGIAFGVTYESLAEWLTLPENQDAFYDYLNGVSVFQLSYLVGAVIHAMNLASARSSQSNPIEGLPWGIALCFGVIVSALHFGAWVPVALGSVMMMPVFLLPLLIYRVMDQDEPAKPKVFTIEETCRAQDTVYMSKLIRDFRERYPKSNAYQYKTNQNHTAGGILLHSKEAIPEMKETYIEVTLKCPFTTKYGVFAEGKEVFFAYLSRHLKTGTIVSALPQKEWQLWLEGLTDSEWYDRIEALKGMDPTHPSLEDYPCQLTDISIKWEPFQWT